MATIARLNVMLTATAGAFTSTMKGAGQTLSGVESAFVKVTDSALAWKSLSSNMGELKLAGRDTIQALQTTFAVARSELQKFMKNADVKVAVNFAADKLTTAWNNTKGFLQSLVDRSHIVGGIELAERGAGNVQAWLLRTKAKIGRGIRVPLDWAHAKFDQYYIAARLKIEGLRRFPAVRIGLALIDRLRLPATAALAALKPLSRVATAGLKVVLSASHVGITYACKAAQAALSGLQSMASTVLGALSKGFLAVGAVAGVAGFGIFELVRHTMEGIDATAKLSDRLGIATDKLMGLQYAAGVAGIGAEQLSDGMGKMLKSIGEAADGTGTASAAFAHLRLDATKLANMPTDQVFSTIAEKLKGIENPAERAAVTMEIFGRSGQELLPLMMKGAGGISALQSEAEKLGLTMDRTDAGKVEKAGESIRRLEGVIEGIKNKLTVALAPYIDAVAEKLTKMAGSGEGMGKRVVNAVGWVVKTVANLTDYFSLVEAGWFEMSGAAAKSMSTSASAIAKLLKGFDWILEKMGLVKKGWGDMAAGLATELDTTSKEMFQKAGKHWDNFNNSVNSKAATKALQEIQDASAKAAAGIAADAAKLNGGAASTDNYTQKLQQAAEDAKRVKDTLDGLQKEIDTFGMSDAQKRAHDLSGSHATPEQIASAQKMADQLDRMTNARKAADAIADMRKELSELNMTEAQKKLAALKLPGIDTKSLETLKALTEQIDAMKEGKSIFDDTRTPMEKYESQISKLGDLLGKGAISWDTYGRAVRKARSELEKMAEQKSPELFQSGTAAAQQYEYQNQHQRAFDFSAGSQKQDATRNAREEQQFNEIFQSRLILQRIDNNTQTANASALQVVDIT